MRGVMPVSQAVSARKWWDEHSLSLRRLLEVFLAFGCGVLNIVSFGSPYWLDMVTVLLN